MVQHIKLTLNDRCDACNAAATTVVWLDSQKQLNFCLHHTKKHRAALEAEGATIIIINDLENNV